MNHKQVEAFGYKHLIQVVKQARERGMCDFDYYSAREGDFFKHDEIQNFDCFSPRMWQAMGFYQVWDLKTSLYSYNKYLNKRAMRAKPILQQHKPMLRRLNCVCFVWVMLSVAVFSLSGIQVSASILAVYLVHYIFDYFFIHHDFSGLRYGK